MAAKVYTAPLLANSEILLCLQELCGQSFPETAITKPDPETVTFILEHLVERLVGVSREELNSVVPEALTAIEYPALHEHSIPNMTFLRYLFILLEACKVVNFGFRDLIHTTQGRWKQCLSQIINFAKFREAKFMTYAKLTAEAEQLTEEKLRADRAYQEAADRLAKLKETLTEEEPEAQKLSQQAQALMQELAQLTKVQGTELAETKQLKTEYESIRAQVKEAEGKKQSLQQANTKLKGRLVQSPEKFKRNLADLSNRLQKEQQSRGETERKRAEVDKRLLEIRKINKMLHKCIKLLEELAVEQDKVKEEKRKVKEEKAAILFAEESLREIRINQQTAARQISSIKDTKLQRLNENHEQRRKRLVDLQEKTRLEKQAIDKDADIMATRIDQIQLEIQKLQNEQQVAGRDHEDNISNLQHRLTELFGQIAAYQKTLTREMEAVSSVAENAPSSLASPIV